MPVLLVYGVAYSIDRLVGQMRPPRFARCGIAVRWRSMSTANTALEGTLSNSLSGETEVYAPLYESLHLRKRQIIAHNV